jgi:carboxyl-terminal processing protease
LTPASGALYIRFDTFNDPVIIDKVVAAVDSADQHGLILDLRGNTGGLVSLELRVMSRLLPPRSILGYSISASGTETWRASILGEHYQGPLVVLIGPRSSSAAEVMADVVKTNHRGMLIGRFTNGSVLVGAGYPLPDGGSVHIPTSDYLGPDKDRIEGVGVAPDIEIIPTLNEIRAGHDLVLERAESELQKGI